MQPPLGDGHRVLHHQTQQRPCLPARQQGRAPGPGKTQARQPRQTLGCQIAHCRRATVRQRHPAPRFQFRHGAQEVGQSGRPAKGAKLWLGAGIGPQSHGCQPHQPGPGILQIEVKRGAVGESVLVDIPAPRGDHAVKHLNRQGCLADQVMQRARHLMRAGLRFGHDIAPPLQPHFGNHRFLGDPGGVGNFQIKGIKRPQPGARGNRGRHDGRKAVGVAAFDKGGAGLQAHLSALTWSPWHRAPVSR